jgi:hypothetical protein
VTIRALRLVNRYPVTDAGEILQLDSAPGVFGSADHCLADHMIDIPSEPGFLMPSLHKQTLSGLSTFGLEPGAELSVTVANRPDGLTTVSVAVGVGSDVNDAEVHPEPFFWFAPSGRLRDFDDDCDVKLAVAVEEVSSPPPCRTCSGQPAPLPDDRNNDPARQC